MACIFPYVRLKTFSKKEIENEELIINMESHIYNSKLTTAYCVLISAVNLASSISLRARC
jgi:hypothetical protein